MDTSKGKQYRNKNWLIEQYCYHQKSLHQIRRENGFGINTIKRWLRKYNIAIRKLGNSIVSKQQGQDKRINPNKIGYSRLHVVMRNLIPHSDRCNKCGKIVSQSDCSNISGEYKDDVSDWEWLCRSCHVISDGRPKKMLAGRCL